jgi:hypothetical protein
VTISPVSAPFDERLGTDRSAAAESVRIALQTFDQHQVAFSLSRFIEAL